MKKITEFLILMFVLIVFAQTSFSRDEAADQKTQLVNELVKLSFPVFPISLFEGDLKSNNQELLSMFKKQVSADLNAKLDANERFSAEKKADVKAKLPALIDKIGTRLSIVVTQDLNIPQWIKEALAENYSREFTVTELRTLTNFFKGPRGKSFIDMVKEEAAAKVGSRPSKSGDLIQEKDAVAIAAFLKKPVAVKFMNTFTLESDKYLDGKIDKWSKSIMKNVEVEMKSGEIHKMLTTFMEENK